MPGPNPFSAENSPNETVTLRGSGRGDGYLIAYRGFGVVPPGQKNAGKRLVGLYAGSLLEVYVESVPGIFSYDLSLGGLWSRFQGLDGVYHGGDDPVTWPAYDAVSAYLSEEVSALSTNASPFWSSSLSGIGPGYAQDELSNPLEAPPVSAVDMWAGDRFSVEQARGRPRASRQIVAKKPVVVKSRAERKLALDKDI